MTLRRVFCTVIVLVSLATAGAVVFKPQIVQQGLSLFTPMMAWDNHHDEDHTDDEDMLSNFFRSNQNSHPQHNPENVTLTTTNNTPLPPSISDSAFPTFPTTINPPNQTTHTPNHDFNHTPNPAPHSVISPTNSPNSTSYSSPIVPNLPPNSPNVNSPLPNINSSSPPLPPSATNLHNTNPPPTNFNVFPAIPTLTSSNSTPPPTHSPSTPPPTSNDIFAFAAHSSPSPSPSSDNNAALLNDNLPVKEGVDNFEQFSDPLSFATASTTQQRSIPKNPQAESSPFGQENISNIVNNTAQHRPDFPSVDQKPFNGVVQPVPLGQDNSNANIFPSPSQHNPPPFDPDYLRKFSPIYDGKIFPDASPPTATPDGRPLPPPPANKTTVYSLPSVDRNALHNPAHSSTLAINPSVISEEISCIGTETVARVGCEVILLCDILPQLRRFGYRILNENLKSLPKEQRAEVTDEEKNMMLAKCIEVNYQEFLKMQIEGSLVYNDFLMNMPREQAAVYEKRLNDDFERKDVPAMIKEFGVKGNVELKKFLEEKLGSSLERERMLATRNKIIQMWVARSVQESDAEATCDELKEYYDKNLEKFTKKERVKWKEMVVLHSKFKSKDEAYKKTNWLMGEILRGVEFEGLAKLNSDGLTAPEGGLRDWTKRGDVSSKIIEKIIFEMPANKISNIIETENSFNIIVVTEKEKETVIPFIEAQANIRKKIKSERLQKKQVEYMENLKQKYHVIVLKKVFNTNMAKPVNKTLR
jgi:ribosomal 30S subunit maturation factor RimM